MSEHTIEITALAHGGDGIGRIEGQVCFVPFGLPGDRLHVQITRRAKQALWGEILAILEASPHRIKPADPSFGRCPLCTWSHFTYPAQAEWKQRIVRETLERIGHVQADLQWCENPALRIGCRTRAEFHGDGHKLGFFSPGSHEIVDAPGCFLCHDALNAALEELRKIGIKGAADVTVNPEGEEVLLWTKFPQRRLKHRFPLANTPRDETARAVFLFDGVPIVNGAFTQASLLLNRLLVPVVHRMIGSAESVLDLYCGSGNLSLGLPQSVRVLGIDHNRAAIHAANQVRQGAYIAGNESDMQKHVRQQEWDMILLDPPRAGAKDLAPALAECSARNLVYVSCDPATLARDLKTILAGGWKLAAAAVVDMFPNTPHIETVCKLER